MVNTNALMCFRVFISLLIVTLIFDSVLSFQIFSQELLLLSNISSPDIISDGTVFGNSTFQRCHQIGKFSIIYPMCYHSKKRLCYGRVGSSVVVFPWSYQDQHQSLKYLSSDNSFDMEFAAKILESNPFEFRVTVG